MLPNLIVIGGAKCGGSSLHYYLGLHPEIFMSREFEAAHHLVEASALARQTYLEYFAPQRFRHFIETSLATRNSQQA